MLIELGRRMDEHSENFNAEKKYKKVFNRSHRVEEYNGIARKMLQRSSATHQVKEKEGSMNSKTSQMNSPNQSRKNKKVSKKTEDSLRDS